MPVAGGGGGDVMSDLRTAAQQALEAWQDQQGMKRWCEAMDVLGTALEQPEQATCKESLQVEQPEQQPTWRLSCGCPSQHGGILAEWPETDREGNPAVAYGVVCEKHWHEYEARCPNCASLEAQNTELDRKLAELERNA